MKNKDSTILLLEDIITQLFKEQMTEKPPTCNSYLMAGDGQFLGEIVDDETNPNSIINEYGLYGSRYSPVSIFNPNSPYGNINGKFSVNNDFSTNPPKLFINGEFKKYVTSRIITNNILSTKRFIYLIKNHDFSRLFNEAEKPACRTAISSRIKINKSYLVETSVAKQMTAVKLASMKAFKVAIRKAFIVGTKKPYFIPTLVSKLLIHKRDIDRLKN